jgi:hypothetical protein
MMNDMKVTGWKGESPIHDTYYRVRRKLTLVAINAGDRDAGDAEE